MDNYSADYILDNFRGIRRDRALKIASGKLDVGDEEFKKFVMCELIRCRKETIKIFKELHEAQKARYLCNKKHESFQKLGKIVASSEMQLIVSEIDEAINKLEETLAIHGGSFTDFLRLNIISEHEACQLFNINHKTWESKKKRYLNLKGKKEVEHLVYSIISITGVEYRERKGRIKECYDCCEYEMPLYWAMYEYIVREMENNREFKETANKIFLAMFPDIKKYSVINDLEGNIVKVEEVKENNSK